MQVRVYGGSGPLVILIHGGPGALGYLGPLAEVLADSFRVLEPFQRSSGAVPLTVARHVEDLHELIAARAPGRPPALVGHSWGAMLALAYAAAHPESAGPIVLVSSGTFDRRSRARLKQILDERITGTMRRQMKELESRIHNPDELMCAQFDVLLGPYSHDMETAGAQPAGCDRRAMDESWDDMKRLQECGIYPAAFSAIAGPVLMLHGTVDPHPGRMILESLRPHIRRIEYREFERCGHYPWLEREAREEFAAVLKSWLLNRSSASRCL